MAPLDDVLGVISQGAPEPIVTPPARLQPTPGIIPQANQAPLPTGSPTRRIPPPQEDRGRQLSEGIGTILQFIAGGLAGRQAGGTFGQGLQGAVQGDQLRRAQRAAAAQQQQQAIAEAMRKQEELRIKQQDADTRARKEAREAAAVESKARDDRRAQSVLLLKGAQESLRLLDTEDEFNSVMRDFRVQARAQGIDERVLDTVKFNQGNVSQRQARNMIKQWREDGSLKDRVNRDSIQQTAAGPMSAREIARMVPGTIGTDPTTGETIIFDQGQAPDAGLGTGVVASAIRVAMRERLAADPTGPQFPTAADIQQGQRTANAFNPLALAAADERKIAITKVERDLAGEFEKAKADVNELTSAARQISAAVERVRAAKGQLSAGEIKPEEFEAIRAAQSLTVTSQSALLQDPGSTVREGESARIRGVMSAFENVWSTLSSFGRESLSLRAMEALEDVATPFAQRATEEFRNGSLTASLVATVDQSNGLLSRERVFGNFQFGSGPIDNLTSMNDASVPVNLPPSIQSSLSILTGATPVEDEDVRVIQNLAGVPAKQDQKLPSSVRNPTGRTVRIR